MRLTGAAALHPDLGRAAAAQTAGTGRADRLREPAFSGLLASNALEIVQRVPGFTLDVGSQEVRGFGQAAGNVVINGQRPSSKSDTLRRPSSPGSRRAGCCAGRVRAGRPVRLRICRARPQVLNLVTHRGGGPRRHGRRPDPAATSPAAVAGRAASRRLLRRGRSSFNVSAGFNNNRDVRGRLRPLTALRAEPCSNIGARSTSSRPLGRSAGSWEYAGGDNRTAHLNGRVRARLVRR